MQLANADGPILVMLPGIVTLLRLLQDANAPSPMLVTLLPIVTPVRLVQNWNVHLPMLLTPSGIVTLGSLVHPAKALGPICRHAVTDNDAGQTAAGYERRLSDAGDAIRNCDGG